VSIIASVTTTGRRIGQIVPTLESIRQGTLQPDRLILWLNHDASAVGPGVREADIPPAVHDLCEVRWCDNFGPATKLLPAMLAFPDDTVVTFDDDNLYSPEWLGGLMAGAEQFPGHIAAYRCKRAGVDRNGEPLPYRQWPVVKCATGPSRWLVPTGVAGVLYPPGSLRSEAFSVGLMRRLSLANDDLWFAATRAVEPVALRATNRIREERRLRGARLSKRNLHRGRNDQIIKALTRHFGPRCPWADPQEF
jgi:hypothetical protein